MAENNQTNTEQIKVEPRAIDFVTQFSKSLKQLTDVLGVIRPIEKQEGTKLVSYKASITLQDGNVAEGETIPASQAKVQEVAHKDLSLKKFRKVVTAEAVQKFGAKVAVTKTDEALKNQLQNNVIDEFYAELQKGTLTDEAETLQHAIAKSISKVIVSFEKQQLETGGVVTFVNTEDFYEYLGGTPITLQTNFGVKYVEDFMGADVIVLSSKIPSKKVISCPKSNIDLYYINPTSAFSSIGLVYTSDSELPVIGYHADADFKTASGNTYATMGMALWAEHADGISVITVKNNVGA